MDPLTILSIGGKILDKITDYFPSAEAKDKAKLALLEMQQRGELAFLSAETQLAVGQIEVNKNEAANQSFFVSGWRPSVGWACSATFITQYVIGPLTTYISHAVGHPIDFPKMDFSELMPILLGMLGLGGYRTIEKIKGAS